MISSTYVAPAAASGLTTPIAASDQDIYPAKIPSCLGASRPWSGVEQIWIASIAELATDSRFEHCPLVFVTRGQIPQTIDLSLLVNGCPHIVRISPADRPITVRPEDTRIIQRFHFRLLYHALRKTKDAIQEDDDFAFLFAPAVHNPVSGEVDIDWLELERSFDFDPASFSVRTAIENNDPLLSECVLVDRYYDRHKNRIYLIQKIEHDLSPFKPTSLADPTMSTAKHYLERFHAKDEIDPNQPLVRVLRLDRIYRDNRPQPLSPISFLIPQFCAILPIKKQHLVYALKLPMLMLELYHQLNTLEICSVLQLPMATVSRVQTALTGTQAHRPWSYERLETLGDSFLKVYLAVHFFSTTPCDESSLHLLKIQMERNEKLAIIGRELGVANYYLIDRMERQDWKPPMSREVVAMSTKMLADVVEALIGSQVVYDWRAAVRLLSSLYGSMFRPSFAEYVLQWAQIREEVLTKKKKKHIVVTEDRRQALSKIEDMIHYRFTDLRLLSEALTHSGSNMWQAARNPLSFSAGRSSAAASYERLEFIVTRFLYARDPPLTPHHLTDMRSEFISNQFLSCVAIALDLHNVISNASAGLWDSLVEFDGLFKAQLEHYPSNPGFWKALPKAPKVFGDLYEAMLGAVFVDSGFDIDLVWGIVRRTLICPWWDSAARSLGPSNMIEVGCLHPTQKLYWCIEEQLGCQRGLEFRFV
ncbi:ribonuclease III domain-containing protein [Polychytrium aggregatum]|uniref:ribonuclease III domain-containing protein n=1 Tax=Polychytrium aggregatum TaxID=110093 RepID=UPI0022FEFAE1|nr:ribonuclease III domain-containing protein [Polychytrium aggregatum]KAI9205947.1 ribonuclease III domain-containing protein [Polychytrium aggregatum]